MRAALLPTAVALIAAAPAASPRTSDLGRFAVTGVRIDPALSNSQQRFFRDDPRFVGRRVEIAPRRLALDGSSPCTAPRRRWSRGTVAGLLRAELGRAPGHGRPYPTPADMGLTGAEAGSRPLDIVSYRCAMPDTGQGAVPGRDWVDVSGFPLAPGRRGLIWAREVVLILSPVGTVASTPSFACARASGPSERAICGDATLASWDRSVATAYRLLRDGDGDDFVATDDPGALQASQRAWTSRRNRCGAARRCLANLMQERVGELMRRQF